MGPQCYKVVKSPPPPVILLLAVPKRLFYFSCLVILDVACCYLWLFSLYVNIKVGKIVVKVRLDGDLLYREIAVLLAVVGGVYDSVFLCCPFSHKMSWMRSRT